MAISRGSLGTSSTSAAPKGVNGASSRNAHLLERGPHAEVEIDGALAGTAGRRQAARGSGELGVDVERRRREKESETEATDGVHGADMVAREGFFASANLAA